MGIRHFYCLLQRSAVDPVGKIDLDARLLVREKCETQNPTVRSDGRLYPDLIVIEGDRVVASIAFSEGLENDERQPVCGSPRYPR